MVGGVLFLLGGPRRPGRPNPTLGCGARARFSPTPTSSRSGAGFGRRRRGRLPGWCSDLRALGEALLPTAVSPLKDALPV